MKISTDGCAAASRDLAVVTEPLREQKGLWSEFIWWIPFNAKL